MERPDFAVFQKETVVIENANKYAEYTAKFDRVGFKSTMYHYVETRYISKVVTICLKNIRDESGNLVADHNWFNYTYDFAVCKIKLEKLKKSFVINF